MRARMKNWCVEGDFRRRQRVGLRADQSEPKRATFIRCARWTFELCTPAENVGFVRDTQHDIRVRRCCLGLAVLLEQARTHCDAQREQMAVASPFVCAFALRCERAARGLDLFRRDFQITLCGVCNV